MEGGRERGRGWKGELRTVKQVGVGERGLPGRGHSLGKGMEGGKCVCWIGNARTIGC